MSNPNLTPPTGSSTTATGRTAETLAATHLAKLGHTILDRNWRNRWCEIDVVTRTPMTSTAAATIHIIEVKYRRTVAYGYAAEYISRDKIARLIRAAAAWCQAHNYAGPYQLDIIAVEGDLARPTITVIPDAISA